MIWCLIAVIVCQCCLIAFFSYFFTIFFFFFQAEDGIRDLVRSRGLGDVYKRQRHGRARRTPVPQDAQGTGTDPWAAQASGRPVSRSPGAVSYTHLTLPTSDLV